MKKRPTKHGGKRKGAGRKPGIRNRKTKKVLEQVEATGKTPLDIMLDLMRAAYERGQIDAALEAAKAAAPYVHPKLQAIEHTGANGSQLVPKRLEVVFVKAQAPDLDELLKDE